MNTLILNPLDPAEITRLLTRKPKRDKVKKKRRELKADTLCRNSDGQMFAIPFAQLRSIQVGGFEGRATKSRRYIRDDSAVTVISYPCGKIVK